MIENKQKFISQNMISKTPIRVAEESAAGKIIRLDNALEIITEKL